jgi:hypothetical protein
MFTKGNASEKISGSPPQANIEIVDPNKTLESEPNHGTICLRS